MSNSSAALIASRNGSDLVVKAGGRGERVSGPGSVDLSDPDLYANGDPHAVWRSLRRAAPVCWNLESNGPGFWAVTSYRHAVEVYRRAGDFSSARGIALRADRWNPDPAGGRMLALTDPPRHGKVRALINRAFTPRMIARLETSAETLCGQLLDAALEGQTCEFVEDIAARLPVAMTCALMGIPEADWALLYALTSRAFGAEDPAYQSHSSAGLSAASAHTELMVYYGRLIAERRRDPRNDVVSALANGEVDGVSLPRTEVLLHCDNLHVAGHETLRHAIAGGVLALIDAPNQWRRLARGEVRLDRAVEEILRWTSPGMHVLRTAGQDTELGGQQIGAGECVTVWNISANRDGRTFPCPDRFDLERSPNRHLALGTGEHYCLGAALARLQLRAFFAQFCLRVRSASITGPVVRLRSNLIAGYSSVPLSLEPL